MGMPSVGDRLAGSRTKSVTRGDRTDAAPAPCSPQGRGGWRLTYALPLAGGSHPAGHLLCPCLLGPWPCSGSLEGTLRPDTLHSSPIPLLFVINKFIYSS